MNIYFVNKRSKWRRPIDVKDTNKISIITVGDICIHDTNDGLIMYYINSIENFWNSCIIIDRGNNDKFYQQGNALLFSHNGVSKRRGNIKLLKDFIGCFHRKCVDSFFKNAIDILEYKRDFWDFGIFQNLYDFSSNCTHKTTPNQEKIFLKKTNKSLPSIFTSYFDDELVNEIISSFENGNKLHDIYTDIKERNPIEFRKAFKIFFQQNPDRSIYDKFDDTTECYSISENKNNSDSTNNTEWYLTTLSFVDESCNNIAKIDEIRKGNNDENNSNIFEKYINTIDKYHIYNDEEINCLFKQYRNGNKKAHDLIVKSNLKFVAAIAKKYCRNNSMLMDMIQEGNIGLLKAIEHYDYLRISNFTRYAKYWITCIIKTNANFLKQGIRIPNNVCNQHYKIHKLRRDFIQKHNYHPSIYDIMSEYENTYGLEYDYNNANFILQLPENLNDLIVIDDPDTYSMEYSNIDTYIEADYRRKKIQFYLSCIDKKDKYILCAKYGINHSEETLQSIGDNINLTKERVRQKCIEIISYLKKQGEKSITKHKNVSPSSLIHAKYIKMNKKNAKKEIKNKTSISKILQNNQLTQYQEVKTLYNISVGSKITYKKRECTVKKIQIGKNKSKLYIEYNNGVIDVVFYDKNNIRLERSNRIKG